MNLKLFDFLPTAAVVTSALGVSQKSPIRSSGHVHDIWLESTTLQVPPLQVFLSQEAKLD